MNVKKIFLALYFVFDFLMSLFPIAFFAWRTFEKRIARLAAGNWSIMYFLVLYLLLTSVIGIVLSKKKNLDDENLTVSKNWLLPIYIVNVIGAFFLMFPFCIAFDCLSKKQFDVFAVGVLKYFVCLSNPLRVGATMLFLFALILPI